MHAILQPGFQLDMPEHCHIPSDKPGQLHIPGYYTTDCGNIATATLCAALVTHAFTRFTYASNAVCEHFEKASTAAAHLSGSLVLAS
mmetsp:Transcript_1531/g.3455  ORF Transcript_1531/g.3455 Transcript_1531/m.3455 type:complete len:87 (-) Transcript_1531:492-752(-)